MFSSSSRKRPLEEDSLSSVAPSVSSAIAPGFQEDVEEKEEENYSKRRSDADENTSGDPRQEMEVDAECRRCPYLDTVVRGLLDLDMPRSCSATLAVENVYACLVCGRFLRGRGKHTPLFTHW